MEITPVGNNVQADEYKLKKHNIFSDSAHKNRAENEKSIVLFVIRKRAAEFPLQKEVFCVFNEML
jgi:hypothetical protein